MNEEQLRAEFEKDFGDLVEKSTKFLVRQGALWGYRKAMESNTDNLPYLLARSIMSAGDEPDSPAKRIEFKGGTWPDNEIAQGGFNEYVLANHIASVLRNLLATTPGSEE